MIGRLLLFHVVLWTCSTTCASSRYPGLVASFQHNYAVFSKQHSTRIQHNDNDNQATTLPSLRNTFHNNQHQHFFGRIQGSISAHHGPHTGEFDTKIKTEEEKQEISLLFHRNILRGAKKKDPPLTRRQWISKSISACATASSAGFSLLANNPQRCNAATASSNTFEAQPDIVRSSSTSPLNPIAKGDGRTSVSTNVPSTFAKSLCDPSVSTFRNPSNNRIVHILGTAHISSASAEVAGQLVRDIKPSAVFVELDAKRVGRTIPKPTMSTTRDNEKDNSEKDEDGNLESQEKKVQGAVVVVPSPTSNNQLQPSSFSSSETNHVIEKMKSPFNIKEKLLNKASQLVGNTIKGLYQKLESEGFSAGEEFIVAVREGLNVGSQIVLGDQDVEVTLRRLTEALSKTDMKKLLAADAEIEQNMKQLLPADIAKSVNGSGEMSKEEFRYFVETIKAKENVKMLMANLQSVAPEVYQAMVGERDVYMANGLDRLNQFDSIVAVMGVAHVDGVERTLKERGWEEIKYPKQCV
jgi:Uncharacterized homolog of PrgY (pheromone shutdown protein)